MKEMGPFSEIFANLESMNRAVSNALVESAKVCSTYLMFQYLASVVKPLKPDLLMPLST